MPRSGAEARTRLREAALELYLERGYDSTTTAQIAERAGVTERTYVRHFPDKREVVCGGEDELRETLVGAIAGATEGTSPLDLVIGAYVAAIPLFVTGRPIATRRAAIMAGVPALEERAHAKSAALAESVTTALIARGIAEATARLAVSVGAARFEAGMRQWYARPGLDLGELLQRAVVEVRAL